MKRMLLVLPVLLFCGIAQVFGTTPVMVQDFEQEASPATVFVVNIPNENASVQLSPEHPSEGKQSLKLHYHFTGEGQYLGIPIPVKIEAPIHKLHFMLYGDASGCGYGIYLTDASGETHKYRNADAMKIDFTGWKEIVVDLDGGHEIWGGDANGKIDSPITNITFEISTAGKDIESDLYFDAVIVDSDKSAEAAPAGEAAAAPDKSAETAPAGEAAAAPDKSTEAAPAGEASAMVQNFEEESSPATVWVVNIPNENASVQLSTDHPSEGKQSLKLHYHFTGDGQYLGVTIPVKIETPVHKLHLMLYGDGSGATFGLYVMDASGETHKYRSSGQPTIDFKGWKEVVVDLDAGHETWGGDANGKIDYPTANIVIEIGTHGKDLESDLYFDAITAK